MSELTAADPVAYPETWPVPFTLTPKAEELLAELEPEAGI